MGSPPMWARPEPEPERPKGVVLDLFGILKLELSRTSGPAVAVLLIAGGVALLVATYREP